MWAKKDQGAWTLPKGEIEDDEEQLAAAPREFEEERGFEPSGDFMKLEAIRQKSGKVVTTWAFEGDCDPAMMKSNTCRIEWPPRLTSSRDPEVDRGQWFSVEEARKYICEEQQPLLARLRALLQAGLA